MDAIREHFLLKEKVVSSVDFDGYRCDFDDWWFNVRPSNTEPYLRFIAEAKDPEKLKKVVTEVKTIIRTISGKA
jgi:phosphomannomutase